MTCSTLKFIINFAVMDSFFVLTLQSDELFKRLKRMQNYLFEFKKLKKFQLPSPVCLQNQHTMNMFHLNNEWLDIFPSLKTVEKLIKEDKSLFFVPKKEEHYYLYYHLLVAYKKFVESGDDKKIYDDDHMLDYNSLSDYLARKNLDATKFFEIYFEKGSHDLVGDELAYATLEKIDLDENISREMSSEPVVPPLELTTIETNEISKVVSPSSSLEVEVDLENYPEEKVVGE